MKGVKENDWVIPFKPHMGSWRSLAVWKAADLLKLPTEVLSLEHAALAKQLCLAYRLLEETKSLKVRSTRGSLSYRGLMVSSLSLTQQLNSIEHACHGTEACAMNA